MRGAVGPVLLAALLSACGTTVGTAARDGSGLGQGVPDGSAVQQPLTTGSGPLSQVPGTSSTADLPVTAPGDTPGETQVPGAQTTRDSRPGASTSAGGTVAVGVVYLGDDQALSALGGNGSQSYGNERDNYVALFADVNRRGGLAGRRVHGEFLAISSAETGTSDEVQQRICVYFTQDHPVRAVLSTLSAYIGDTLRTCLGRAGVVLVSNSLTSGDARTFAAFPSYLEPTGLRVDRIAAALPAGLARKGFFAKGAKVGVLTVQRSTFQRATAEVLVPALRRLGHEPRVIAVRDPESDAAGAGSDVSSAVLQMSSAGVTHVLLLSPNGTLALLFTNQAESQQYRPAYGFTSQDAINGLVEGGFIQNPREQLAKAAGVGWQPWLDVPLADNPLRTRGAWCFDLLKKAGVSYTASAARWHAALGCDTVALLEKAATAAPVTAASLLAGVRQVGTRRVSPATFAVDLRERRDGAAAVRAFAFTAGCTCFRYTGGDVQV